MTSRQALSGNSFSPVRLREGSDSGSGKQPRAVVRGCGAVGDGAIGDGAVGDGAVGDGAVVTALG
jgi:hypothetical protein